MHSLQSFESFAISEIQFQHCKTFLTYAQLFSGDLLQRIKPTTQTNKVRTVTPETENVSEWCML